MPVSDVVAAFLVALGLLLGMCTGARPFEVGKHEDVLDVIAGVWDWADATDLCAANPHVIEFTDDRRYMDLTFAEPFVGTDGVEDAVTRYEVRAVTRGSVRGFIEGETRTTPSGEPVVWDLVLTSRDSYCWHRTDWRPGACTKPVVRCPPAAP